VADLARIEAAANPAAGIEAYKIEVDTDGIYRVSFAALAAAGFPAAPVPFTDLRLELRGQAVPIESIDADRDGRFGPGDAIEFFGVANPERWSSKHVYWLTRQGGGRWMRRLAALPPGAGSWRSYSSVKATLHAEKDQSFFIFSA